MHPRPFLQRGDCKRWCAGTVAILVELLLRSQQAATFLSGFPFIRDSGVHAAVSAFGSSFKLRRFQ